MMPQPDNLQDLRSPYNRRVLKTINWRHLKLLRGTLNTEGKPIGPLSLFRLAICNPQDCPVGYPFYPLFPQKCASSFPWCHFWEVLKTVEYYRHQRMVIGDSRA